MTESKRGGIGQPSEQIRAAGQDATSAPHIPLPLTSLVGREQAVQQVSEQLLSGRSRLLTLTGPGGVGKTRLALQVAAEIRGKFTHGAYFVPLAQVNSPQTLLPAIAQTLGVLEKVGQTPLEGLCAALQERHLLLILDNFEQIVAAGPQVLDLLMCAPRLQVLVTSRTILHVYGEQDYPVLPLTLPDVSQQTSLEQLTQYEAVRLFVARARAAKPGFAVTNSSAPAVAEICHRLDGLPLAIELAAARVRLLSPQALLKRLDRSLPLLTGGAITLPYRHQTLRDAIAWSYDLISPEEQRVFRCLAVFSGGCTLEASDAICGTSAPGGHVSPELETESATLDILSALVDKSLLRQEEQEDSEPRFHMLETIREFAWEQLVSNAEEHSAGARHTRFFIDMAERALPEMTGANQSAWLDRIAFDYDNLRAVFRRAQHAGDTTTSLHLGWLLWHFWYIRGYRNEGRAWLSEALESGGAVPAELRARALRTLGNLAGSQGDYDTARKYHEQVLQISQELRDKRGIAVALGNLANTARNQGDYVQAKTLFGQAAALNRELGQSGVVNLATSLFSLGTIISMEGDHDEAMRLCLEALQLQDEIGDMHGKASTLNRMGLIMASQGRLEESRAFQQQSLERSRELKDKPGVARALYALGVVAAEGGDPAGARTLLSESLTMRYVGGNKRTIAESIHDLAIVDREGSDLERLVLLLAVTGAVYRSVGSRFAPHEERQRGRWLLFAREKIGDRAYASAWQRGGAMPLDDAVAIALEGSYQETPTSSGRSSIPPKAVADLTPRELEVLRLVAVGLTNPGIASHLNVSINTVQTHLRSIFSKIHVSTRGAAVRYAFEHHLG